MNIHVGCCGLPMGLEKYSKKFELVELNSTFYKLPKAQTAKNWRECVPENFIFTVKCHQAVTHPITSPTWRRSGLKEAELKRIRDRVGFLRLTKEVFDAWNRNLELCRILAAKVCLIQLPASFTESDENIANAEKFFSKIEREIPIALELRGWSADMFKAICKKFNLISCVDCLKDDPVWFSKQKLAYFRLHGGYKGNKIEYNHRYSRKELEELKSRISNLKVKQVYVLFNNRFMVDNATEFLRLIERDLPSGFL